MKTIKDIILGRKDPGNLHAWAKTNEDHSIDLGIWYNGKWNFIGGSSEGGGGDAGGDAMPIVIVDALPTEDSFNLEAGKLYKCNFNLNDIDYFMLPEPSSSEFVQHIIILGRINASFDDVGFRYQEHPLTVQAVYGIYQGSSAGYYKIDCMYIGDDWLVTAVNVLPDQA